MLQTFLDGMTLSFNFFVSVVTQAWSLMTNQPVLMAVLAVFIIGKVIDIFDIVKG